MLQWLSLWWRDHMSCRLVVSPKIPNYKVRGEAHRHCESTQILTQTVQSLALVVPWVNFSSAELKFIFMHLGQYSMNFLNCLFIPKQSTQVIPLIAACKVWDSLKWFEVSKSWFLRVNILWLFSNILLMKMVSLLDTTGIIIRPKYSAHCSIVIPCTTEYKCINSSGLLLCHREVQRLRNANFRRVGFSSCSLSSWFTFWQFLR